MFVDCLLVAFLCLLFIPPRNSTTRMQMQFYQTLETWTCMISFSNPGMAKSNKELTLIVLEKFLEPCLVKHSMVAWVVCTTVSCVVLID